MNKLYELIDKFRLWLLKKLIPKSEKYRLELLDTLFIKTNSIFLGWDDIDMGSKKIVNLAERSIPRTWLEYPTEDVTFTYLAAINKLRTISGYGGARALAQWILTTDSFTDKGIESDIKSYTDGFFAHRWKDVNNWYECPYHCAAKSTSDHRISKVVGGSRTDLATESVDLNRRELYLGIVSGSTLKSDRRVNGTFELSATDTSLTSGSLGLGNADSNYNDVTPAQLGAQIKPPSSSITPTLIIAEFDIVGVGTNEDPIRPNVVQKLIEVNEAVKRGINVPDYVIEEAKKYHKLRNKGFTDDEIKALLGYIPQHQVDLGNVTWGAFDFEHNKSPTVTQGLRKASPYFVVLIKGGNFYTGIEAIKKQIEYVKSRNLYIRVITNVPRDKAIEIYKELKARGHDFIAGVDDLWYQLNGSADIEPLAVADFYYGNVINLRRLDLSKVVDADRTLKMWLDRLNKSRVSESIKEKHRRKLIEVMKKG